MLFTSPLWLFALLPWAGVVLWLLWGRRRKTPVAFLDLWKGPALQKPAKRALQPPPIFMGLAILAILMALLAGAKPWILIKGGGTGKPVAVIVDRGMSMSANSGGAPRFKIAAQRACNELNTSFSAATPVELIVSPGDTVQASDMSSWVDRVNGLSPTAVNTQAVLDQTVRGRLAASDELVVLISDRKLPFDDPRLIQFSPPPIVDKVGIVQLAAREMPSPQVMVRILNESDRRSVAVKVESAAERASGIVKLPARGQSRNYFFDLPKFASQIQASLDVNDDQPADDEAWLVREGSYPKIEAKAPLSAELRRMIEVYTHSRPSTDGSPTVALVSSESQLPSDSPAVWVAPITGTRAAGAISAAADPVTADVNWSAFPAEVATAGEAPRGWTPVVTMGGHVIVAVRSGPSRQIWIGFDAPTWSATPDFVIFWANVFNWTGQGRERFAAYPLSKLEPGWKPIQTPIQTPSPQSGEWPGLYRTDEGTIRAYNSPAEVEGVRAPDTVGWRQRAMAARNDARMGFELSRPLLAIALGGLIGASFTWKRRKSIAA